MSTSDRMSKWEVVFSFTGILERNEIEWTSSTWSNTGEHHKENIEEEKPDVKEYTWYDAIYMKFKNEQNEERMLATFGKDGGGSHWKGTWMLGNVLCI